MIIALTVIDLPNSPQATEMPPIQFAYADILRENSAYISGVIIIGIVYSIYSVSTCGLCDLRPG